MLSEIENDWIRRGLLIVTFPLFVIGGMALLLSIAMFEMVDAAKDEFRDWPALYRAAWRGKC